MNNSISQKTIDDSPAMIHLLVSLTPRPTRRKARAGLFFVLKGGRDAR